MASFTKRQSGWIQVKVRRKGWPDQSASFETKTEAQAWARQIESGLDRGVLLRTSAAEKLLFDGLASRFRAEFAQHHYRATGWGHKLDHLVRLLGEYSLAALSPEVVANYRDARLLEPDSRYRNKKTAPRISSATVKSELDVLSKVLDVGQKEFGIMLPAGNPVLSVRKPPGSKSRDYRLSESEWAALIQACSISLNRWLSGAVVLAVETAMRMGELRALEWKNVNLSRRVAILAVSTGASKLGEARSIPLSSAAIEALQSLPRHISGRVIPLEKQTLYTVFKTACRRAGVPNYRFHDIRHEALSRLGDRGDFSVLDMSAVSGHKTLQMLKKYTHLDAEKLAVRLG